mmetsp:Transcript_34435/g.78501  ORF Transcript_34435/g.78501 Transcript_34435/m.78501 type:complete len:624 (-) Transcript_34435:39-1910(-)
MAIGMVAQQRGVIATLASGFGRQSFQPSCVLRPLRVLAVRQLTSCTDPAAQEELSPASSVEDTSAKVSVTFIDPNQGDRRLHTWGKCGESIVQVAKRHGVDIQAACGGKLQCATCHVILEQVDYKRLPPKGVREEDLLDTTFTLTQTSRLGCQVRLGPELDGMQITLPDASAKGAHRMSLEQPRRDVSSQSWTAVPASVPSMRRQSVGQDLVQARSTLQPTGLSKDGIEVEGLQQELRLQRSLTAQLESELRQLRHKLASTGGETAEQSSVSSSGSCSSSSIAAASTPKVNGSKKPTLASEKSSGDGEGSDEAALQKAKEELQRTRVDTSKLIGRESFADIIGLDGAKAALKEALLWPAMADVSLFTGVRGQMRGLLLYGPPGCGKTMLARAAAAELGSHAAFFHVQPGDIMSKYYGDSQIRILALQELVREAAPAVVFFDEVDSLLVSRGGSGVAEHYRATTNALLSWMDGFDSSDQDQQVFFLGATNRPEAIDEAALRRFGAAAEVESPTHDARLALLRHMIQTKAAAQGHLAQMCEDDMAAIASRTGGYSLADVDRLVRNSFLEVLRQLPPPGVTPGLKPCNLPPVQLHHFEAIFDRSTGLGTSQLAKLFESRAVKAREV